MIKVTQRFYKFLRVLSYVTKVSNQFHLLSVIHLVLQFSTSFNPLVHTQYQTSFSYTIKNQLHIRSAAFLEVHHVLLSQVVIQRYISILPDFSFSWSCLLQVFYLGYSWLVDKSTTFIYLQKQTFDQRRYSEMGISLTHYYFVVVGEEVQSVWLYKYCFCTYFLGLKTVRDESYGYGSMRTALSHVSWVFG